MNHSETDRQISNDIYQRYCDVQQTIGILEEMVYEHRDPKDLARLSDLRGVTSDIITRALLAQNRGLGKKDGDTQTDPFNPVFIDKNNGIIRCETTLPGAEVPIEEVFSLLGEPK